MIQEEEARSKGFTELLELWGALLGIPVRHDCGKRNLRHSRGAKCD